MQPVASGWAIHSKKEEKKKQKRRRNDSEREQSLQYVGFGLAGFSQWSQRYCEIEKEKHVGLNGTSSESAS